MTEELFIQQSFQDQIINLKSKKQKKVVIVGFPFDEGTKRNGGRIGGANASVQNFYKKAQFRKTLYSSNYKILPQQQTKLLQIIDIGDSSSSQTDVSVLEEGHENHIKTIMDIYLKIHPQLLFSIGGSNDQSFSNIKSLMNLQIYQSYGVINIDAHFDVRPLKNNQCHSGSPFRQMLEDPAFKGKFYEFGNKGCNCSNEHYEYIKSKGGEVIWLEKNIRRHNIINNSSYWCTTQAGQIFEGIIKQLEKEVDMIFVSFDVDSINSAYMPGVSAPSVVGGLTIIESLEIGYITGRSKKVKLFDMSEFNPAVESEKSAKLLCDIFYETCRGLEVRNE